MECGSTPICQWCGVASLVQWEMDLLCTRTESQESEWDMAGAMGKAVFQLAEQSASISIGSGLDEAASGK